MKTLDAIPPISAEEATPLVKVLVAMIENLQEKNKCLETNLQELRDVIAVLKGEKAKPNSTLSHSRYAQ